MELALVIAIAIAVVFGVIGGTRRNKRDES
jgi:hypothetical protein